MKKVCTTILLSGMVMTPAWATIVAPHTENIAATSNGGHCNAPAGTFEPPQYIKKSAPLSLPFANASRWVVGGWGSYFGNGCHNNSFNAYYATDWSRPDGQTYGTPLHPVAAGVVTRVAYDANGLGHYVEVEHDLGGDQYRLKTVYAHQTGQQLPAVGDVVNLWDRIGRAGNSGNSSGAHLHLNLQDYNPGSSLLWSGKCDQQPICGNGADAPEYPGGVRPFHLLTNATGSGHWKIAEIRDGASYEADTRARLFFPGAFNSASVKSKLAVRNNANAAGNVTVYWHQANGALVHTETRHLAVNASAVLELPAHLSSHAAAVVAENDMNVSGVIEQIYNANHGSLRTYASMAAVTQPRVQQSLPLVHHQNYYFNSFIDIQNPFHNQAIKYTIKFSDRSHCQLQGQVSARGVAHIDTTSNSCLSTNGQGYYGSATIETAFLDGSPALAAVSGYQYRKKNNRIDQVIGSNASVDRISQQNAYYAPMIQNNNYGWFSGFNAELGERGSQANVRIRYYNDSGAQCQTTTSVGKSWPWNDTGIPHNTASCGPTLSGRFTIQDQSRYFMAQINQLKGEQDATGYNVMANPTWMASLPLLDTSKQVGIRVMNASGASSNSVRIRYFDQHGNKVGNDSVSTLPANGASHSFSIPSAAVSALVSGSANLSVVVNHIDPNSSLDRSHSYLAPGLDAPSGASL